MIPVNNIATIDHHLIPASRRNGHFVVLFTSSKTSSHARIAHRNTTSGAHHMHDTPYEGLRRTKS